MKFRNKSSKNREICLINGLSVIVSPGDTVELNKSEVYDFEISRISRFFEVTKERIKKIVKTEPEKTEIKEEKNQFLNKTGGDS